MGPQEVEQVAMAAVLCDHQHGACWREEGLTLEVNVEAFEVFTEPSPSGVTSLSAGSQQVDNVVMVAKMAEDLQL